MKFAFRPRLTLLWSMVIVAVVAIVFAWVAMERRKRIQALRVEFQRAQDRLRVGRQDEPEGLCFQGPAHLRTEGEGPCPIGPRVAGGSPGRTMKPGTGCIAESVIAERHHMVADPSGGTGSARGRDALRSLVTTGGVGASLTTRRKTSGRA